MDLGTQAKNLGLEIYNKVTKIVKENKGDNDKYYRNAILSLSDGRKVEVPFHPDSCESNIRIHNYQWNREFQRSSEDSFIILTRSKKANQFWFAW